ncbi:MAG: T9SS type A sorting domain-containing protein [Candidatus Kapabacteria bacterium]|nr:T9SS type A sorting domain-containing protein [Candidatus Kapabacteria bacterium]
MRPYILYIIIMVLQSFILRAFPPGWEVVDYNYNRFYWDVKCIDSMNYMAMSLQGNRTELRKTTDGGLSWKQILNDTIIFKISGLGKEPYGLLCFDFVNKDLGYMGADSGLIFKTTDGGSTWIKIKVNTNRQILNIKFQNSSNGFCLTSKELLMTNDGGFNWFNVAIPDSFIKSSNPFSTYEFYSLQCPDSNSIKIHFYSGKLYFLISDDRGNTWSRSEIPKKGMLSYYFFDRYNGWLIQYYQTSYTDYPQVVLYTTDGGFTWVKSLDTLVKIISGLRKVYFRNIKEGVACGENGVLFRTKDGGKKWEYLISWKDEYPPHYRCCLHPSANLLLVFTDNGYILRFDETKLYVESEIFNQKLKIFPNPAKDYIEIIYNIETALRPVSTNEINIYNILGECVLSVETQHAVSLQRIDISNLHTGIYYVRLGDWVGRFVKIE